MHRQGLASLLVFLGALVTAPKESVAQQVVADDRIMPGSYAYPPVSIADADRWWNRQHFLNERIRNTDGSWGTGYAGYWPSFSRATHPLVRMVASRVIGYIYAYRALRVPLYRQRAIDGLEWLLRKQDSSGQWRFYSSNTGSLNSDYANRYESSWGGRACIEGYREFGDARYRAAADRAAAWMQPRPLVGVPNYNLFGVWFLSAHYRATRNAASLNTAVGWALGTIRGRNGTPYQTRYGYWSDSHDQIMYYQQIIIRGLVELLMAMPANHPDRPTILRAAYKAINYVVTHQNANGSTWHSPTDPSSNEEEWGPEAFGEAHRNLGMPLLNVIRGELRYEFSTSPGGINALGPPTGILWQHKVEAMVVTAGYMVWFLRQGTVGAPPPAPPAASFVRIGYVSTGKAYSLATARIGALPYIDRSYTITGIGPALADGTSIRVAMDDKYVRAATHLRFTLSRAATVYVGFDDQIAVRPAWLDDGTWTATTQLLPFSTGRSLRLYSKRVPAGQVTLGGNLQPPAVAPPGGMSHYVVIVK